ncbi:MAG: AAA family ATPase [Chitinophagaceae bacterium]|nr:AAA family ATPase [Chitinophagaceae bacterium]MCW5925310.1 AAA family ATPase [Chitinophagaceae bacterium]
MNNNGLQGIGFENFRVFKQQTLLDFAPLTILTGTNSSGKSSVINGMKLIGESFKGIKISNDLEEFELDSLFNIEINASEMMKRYGTLEKYVNQLGRDVGENGFRFFIPAKLLYVKENVVISYTIQIDANKKKTGRIISVEMQIPNKKVSLLKIEKLNEKYHIKVDVAAFIHTLIQSEKEKALGPDDSEIVDILQEVAEKIKEGYIYDFSFLWAEDPQDVEIFKYALKKFYGTPNIESLKKLNIDIINTLSTMEWEEERVKNIIYFEDKVSKRKNTGLSLLDTALRYYGSSKSAPNSSHRSLGVFHTKTGLEKLSIEEIEKLDSKNDFLAYLFKIVAHKKSYYDKPLFSLEERKLFEASERKLTEIKSFEPNDVEKYFYEYFLFPNLNLIKTSFLPFISTEAVSAERSSTKGIKSILDNDDFSRLIKRRFSAIGLEKEAFDRLDKFLNKWLREFKVADEIRFEKDEDYDTFKVRLQKNGRWMMLSDEGFGVSQVLPVILSCCPIIGWNYEYNDPFQYNESKLVLIEEPETNLHPALQSKLADMFMDAVKVFNIRFVIETHSEYLVRKLQYLTGKGDIKPENTVIYYFYPPTEVPPGEKQVKKINIRQDGGLTDDFGTGFFDEATNWKFELLALKNHQRN